MIQTKLWIVKDASAAKYGAIKSVQNAEHVRDSMQFVSTVNPLSSILILDAVPQKRGQKDDQIAELIRVYFPFDMDVVYEIESWRNGESDT